MSKNLEHIVDESICEAMRQRQPALLDAIADLLALAVTPEQIERHLARRYGGYTQTARDVRHIAEHLQRKGVLS